MSDSIRGVRTERMPSDADFTSEWRMLRAPTNGRAHKIIIHSHDLLGMRTHYYQRRTGPCYEIDCEACLKNQRSRWNGYVLGQLESGERIIFEFPPPAGKQLDAAFTKYGTMRGLCVVATRTSEKFNAKVHLQEKGLWAQAHTIKLVPETWPVLARIWGVKTMPDAVVGPMDHQTVSEAEMREDQVGLVPTRKPCRTPQKSLLRSPPAAPVEASAHQLLQTIAQEAFINGRSIDRVNGRSQAKK